MIEDIDQRVVIVGAGPTGLYSAYFIKKNNPEIFVSVYEEHSDSGTPMCCSGLIGINGYNKSNLKNYLSIKDCIINKIRGADIYGPHKAKVTINAKENKAYAIDREKFDKKIKDLALSIGVEINYDMRVNDIKDQFIYVKDLKKDKQIEQRFEYLIAADGPNSIIRKKVFGDVATTDFLHTYQIYVNGNFTDSKVELHLGDFAKGLFIWKIPESRKRAKIGIATKLGKNPKESLYNFLEKKKIKYDKENGFCSGILPISKPLKNFVKDNVLIVGDAACFVKATTGGGINFGLLGAEMAEVAITNRIKKKKKLTSYNSLLLPYIRDLKLHYKISRYIFTKNNIEMDEFLQKLNEAGLSEFLENKADMDFPTLFVYKVLSNPKYIKLFPEVIKFLRA